MIGYMAKSRSWKCGPLIWALCVFFLAYVLGQLWALIGIWYMMDIQGFQIRGPY